ncbi:hypothetical protein BaRGS_00017366 [Batillaria attramentaria]|uniref:15-hydroxyprostaglandin dehydrogenase [NAD(+)] n=1 Tax=Batillaria attramentaria TaxID=370345 RepID=A0ABD0KWS3_9CAEN
MDPCGKGVFLTGGARGIGRGLMEALLSKGAKVMFCDVRVETGKATEAELQQKFGADNVFFRECDVTDSGFGAVDICVNNAGILDESNWEKTIEVNLTAQIRGSQLALDHMRRDRGGRGGLIINTVSGIVALSVHFCPVYMATKHGMIGFMTSWAKNPKMKDMGVRWRCFCPALTDTDLLKEANDADSGKVEDFNAYQALCSVEGAVMSVDETAQEFLKLFQDQDSDDAIFLVRHNGASGYVRRQLVDSDGVSNIVTVD